MSIGPIFGLDAVDSQEDDDLSSRMLCFITQLERKARVFDQQRLAFLRRELLEFAESLGFNTLFLGSVVAGIIITVALLARSIYLDRKRIRLLTEATDKLLEESIFSANELMVEPDSDAMYAEELQIQEALLASSFASGTVYGALPSSITNRRTLNHEPGKHAKEVGEPSQSFCGICFEEKQLWQMFRNGSCLHSFCYDCTSKHIVARIQANKRTILCPEVNCKAALDFNTCRLIIPKDVLILWDESLCKSLIPESQTVYCPFNDCSAFLVNDSETVITKIKCPVCQRSFCASCQVPWHTEFSCKEYRRLNAKKTGKEDEMAKELAKKKQWRRCPQCKIYVEKTDGCLHITCRCGYEFCYKCGAKWSGHAVCLLS